MNLKGTVRGLESLFPESRGNLHSADRATARRALYRTRWIIRDPSYRAVLCDFRNTGEETRGKVKKQYVKWKIEN